MLNKSQSKKVYIAWFHLHKTLGQTKWSTVTENKSGVNWCTVEYSGRSLLQKSTRKLYRVKFLYLDYDGYCTVTYIHLSNLESYSVRRCILFWCQLYCTNVDFKRERKSVDHVPDCLVWISSLPLTSCVMLHNLLHLSGLLLPHL